MLMNHTFIDINRMMMPHSFITKWAVSQ